MFNDYFASLYTINNGTNPNFENRTNSELGSFLFSGQSVHHSFMKLKRSHCSGPDSIPNALLQSIAQVLSGPLALLFERSMAIVFIPEIWKTTRIVPMLKKGSPLKASNYRPKSLTSAVSKVMERIITDQLIIIYLLSSQQFGFQKKSSTIIQLLDCFNDWSASQNAGNSVDVIYLDFAKAFDSVVHSKLLLKLAIYGISGNLLAWIKWFLSDRSHFVSINSASSVSQSVFSGVPQGTVVGPILSIIYVNNMRDIFENGFVLDLFADDSKMYNAIKSVKDCLVLQKALVRLVI